MWQRVCGVYQQLYVMLCTECFYFYCIHRALQADAIMQKYVLLIPFGRIVESFSGFFKGLMAMRPSVVPPNINIMFECLWVINR